MDEWKNKKDGYWRKRVEICKQYYEFCKADSAKFYSAKNMLAFVQNHKDKTKDKLTTHVSEIIRNICLLQKDDLSDLASLPSSFNVKNRLDFQSVIRSKPRVYRENKTVPFTSDHLKKLFISHKSSSHKFCSNSLQELFSHHIHRALLQLSLGIRYANTLDLHLSKFVEKTCTNCSRSPNPCVVLTSQCFDKIFFPSSKTGSFSVIIIPQALDCYRLLSRYTCNSSENSTRIDASYTQFLKTFLYPELKKHDLRKYLCNLNLNCHNTGNWKHSSTMKRFYLSDDQKFIELYLLLSSF